MYNGHVPFLLSGGINSYSANALKEFKHPRLAGYDLNSRFELKPGEKDPERIRTFLNELKSELINFSIATRKTYFLFIFVPVLLLWMVPLM